MTSQRAGRFLEACRRRPVDRTPVWLMRQAGRYLPEYRAIRAKHSLLEICHDPALATEITLQPIRRFDLDAAIIFADILLPLVPMGIELEFVEGTGPVIRTPVRTAADIDALHPVDPEDDLVHVLQALRLVQRELRGSIPLIGFGGGPFTLASYLLEGGPSRSFVNTKRFMYNAPGPFQALLRKLTGVVKDLLLAQAAAGADVVQLFDSWVGCLSPYDYRHHVQHHTRRILSALHRVQIPTIHFGVGTSTLLELMRDAGGDVIGLDWRIPLDEGWRRVGAERAVQGNLDPGALFAPRPELRRQVKEVLERAGGRPGHVFNLGHGVLPDTPTDHVEALVDFVHEHDARKSMP